MYKIVVAMAFPWPQLSFSKDISIFQWFFSLSQGFLSFSKDTPRKAVFSMELALEVHAKEGQPVVAKATTGWSLLACNFQS